MDEAIGAVLDSWRRAEERGDVAALDALASPDFEMVGPFGFVLDRTSWLDRYRSGDLTTSRVVFTADSVRRFNQTWVVIGTIEMTATHRGAPAGGRFRSTHILIGDADAALVGMHLSLRQPPGAAP